MCVSSVCVHVCARYMRSKISYAILYVLKRAISTSLTRYASLAELKKKSRVQTYNKLLNFSDAELKVLAKSL
jgi:hypothetical protein